MKIVRAYPKIKNDDLKEIDEEPGIHAEVETRLRVVVGQPARGWETEFDAVRPPEYQVMSVDPATGIRRMLLIGPVGQYTLSTARYIAQIVELLDGAGFESLAWLRHWRQKTSRRLATQKVTALDVDEIRAEIRKEFDKRTDA